ncbi:MAG: biotin/lipoyl-containing protein [Pseudomonadota bacterium]
MARWNIEIDGESYEVDVKRFEDGLAKVVVNGALYEVAWRDVEGARPAPAAVAPAAAPSRMMPSPAPAASHGMAPRGVVASPLPGLILDVLVKPGDNVRRGQVVVKLEAMKMANEVRSQVSGKVHDVYVSKGETVDEGAHLLRIG